MRSSRKFLSSIIFLTVMALSAAEDTALGQAVTGGYGYFVDGLLHQEPNLRQACLNNLQNPSIGWFIGLWQNESYELLDTKSYAMATGDPSSATCVILDKGPNHAGDKFYGEVTWVCPPGYLSVNGICQIDPDRGIKNDDKCEAASNQYVGNPISLASASKEEDVVDFETSGPQPLRLRRYYRARSQPGHLLGDSRWHFDFEYELQMSTVGADLYTPEGEHYQFTKDSSGNFSPSPGEGPISLANNGASGNYKAVLPDGTTVYFLQVVDGARFLVGVARTDGLFLTTSDGPSFKNHITAIYDGATFREIYFSVDQVGNVVSAVDSSNHFKVDYAYSTSTTQGRLLTSVSRYINSGTNIAPIWTSVDSVTYHYESSSFPFLLTGITDERGIRYATWTYDSTARALSSVHAGGADQTTISYNDASLSRTVTNALGRITNYSFLALSQKMLLTSAVSPPSTNAPASQRTVSYDGKGNITTESDEEGRLTSYIRDSYGRPTQITWGAGTSSGVTRSITWAPNLNLPLQLVDPGLTTAYSWNANGQLLTITKTDTTTQSGPYSTSGQTRTWSYGYDSKGLLISKTDPLNKTASYTYDSQSYLKTVTNELGQVTTVNSVNDLGRPTSITDPNGVVTALIYDGRGRVTSIAVDTANSPATTTIEYDQVGQITKITLPNGAYETYTYDGARRLTGVANSAGETITYVRDAMGGATSATVARSDGTTAFQRTRVFDELGRVIRSIGVASQTYSFGYDRTDNLTSIQDPRSNVFSYGLDPLNRLISETDEIGATVNLARNGKDEIVGYQDPRNVTTTYVRNGFGEVIQESSPDKGTTVYVRDARGQVTQKTDPRGVVTNYAYDNAGRLTSKRYPGYSETCRNWQDFTWDQTQPGNFGQGRLVGVSDESGVIWRTYDSKGRVQFDYRTNNPAPAVAVQYSYDADGNVIGMGYPSGRWVAFSRDAVGRISGVSTQQTAASPVQTIASSVSWNPYGPLASLTFGNGLAATYTLDSDYRITRVQVGPSTSPGATLDRSLAWTGDTIDQIIDNQNPGTSPPLTYGAQTQSFSYTPTRRLSAATGFYGSLAWAYDGVGNRLSETKNGVQSSYLYPLGSNRLASVTSANGTTRSFTYDAAGNVLTDTRDGALGMSFEYDVEGRLSHAFQTNAPANGGTYLYDAFGRLASRVVTQSTAPLTTTTLYVHDFDNHIIAETDATGATLREYIWLNDLPIAVVDKVNSSTPQVYFVHSDHLGRPARMTNPDQSWAWDVIYSPFGETSYIWTNPEMIDIRFPGQWFQLESGFAYNWHRHYDATLGRYLQPDPIGLAGGMNRFGYVGENPLAYTDPQGLDDVLRFPVIPLNPAGPPLTGYTYSQRLNFQTDPLHAFPRSYDTEIISNGRITKIDQQSSYCYYQYNATGALQVGGKSKLGTYEIGVNVPNTGGSPEIVHRFFNPR